MKLIFGGGGSGEQSLATDKVFLSLLKENAKILYIPIALRHKYSPEECLKWFNGQYPTLKTQTTLADNLNEINSLNDFEGIYIGGGNTFSLLQEIREANFDKKLIAFAKKGGIIYGGSAGAIILAETILSSTDKNISSLNNFEALRLLKNIAIWPHYKKEQDQKIYEFTKQHKVSILSISEEGGLYFDGNILKILGDNVCLFFSEQKIELNPSL
ncbi:Type 1 glutamine amidotransferase-like domain-containing protein [Candidatus Woesearchaeota archaeon]|nr:Type 1 glutamine amidotransferase-like domain-containing protein [Candidatus Woesearchaeota archaeon]